MAVCQTLNNAGFPQPLPSPAAVHGEHPCDHGMAVKEWILITLPIEILHNSSPESCLWWDSRVNVMHFHDKFWC